MARRGKTRGQRKEREICSCQYALERTGVSGTDGGYYSSAKKDRIWKKTGMWGKS